MRTIGWRLTRWPAWRRRWPIVPPAARLPGLYATCPTAGQPAIFRRRPRLAIQADSAAAAAGPQSVRERRTPADPAGGHRPRRGFRAGLHYGEDWEYWTRLALLGGFVAGARPRSRAVRAGTARQRLSAHGNRSGAIRSRALDADLRQPGHRPPVWRGPIAASCGGRRTPRPPGSIGRELIRHGRCTRRMAVAGPIAAPGARR